MKFAFIAKHRAIWPASWLCEALGVSRSGFHAWLTRAPSARSRSDEEIGAKVRANFMGSDRTYGARRVWHDVLADGSSESPGHPGPAGFFADKQMRCSRSANGFNLIRKQDGRTYARPTTRKTAAEPRHKCLILRE